MQEETIDFVLVLQYQREGRKYLGSYDRATDDKTDAQGFLSVEAADRKRSSLNSMWMSNAKIMARRRVVREECFVEDVQ